MRAQLLTTRNIMFNLSTVLDFLLQHGEASISGVDDPLHRLVETPQATEVETDGELLTGDILAEYP